MATRTPKPPTRSAAKPAAKPATRAAKTDAKPAKPARPAKPAEPPKVAKPKARLVRDSFTMPQADFALVATLKARALDFKRPTKKSELLRAGLHALAQLDNAGLQRALGALTPLKPGRPKKGA